MNQANNYTEDIGQISLVRSNITVKIFGKVFDSLKKAPVDKAKVEFGKTIVYSDV